MNLYDFLYVCLKEKLLTIHTVIAIGLFVLPVWPLLFCLVSKLQSLKLDKTGIEINVQATEKRNWFNFFRRNNPPAILKNNDKQRRERWYFSNAAFYLGQGNDNLHYFIGYFGHGLPTGYKQISVECETIIGVDWDNTPQWNQAFEQVKTSRHLTFEKIPPNYSGNGIRNNRMLHGIYACENDISKEFSD
ncbi:hypothetical protein AGMMS49587_04840 [Spirochaetia bacterium]|nr:hypothetical protein AGMMS49587_04840 [Spirochaetia bacterium]